MWRWLPDSGSQRQKDKKNKDGTKRMIKKLLEVAKQDIISDICMTADIRLSESWLWLPTRKALNPAVCLVAHIDTVFDGQRKRVFHDREKQVYFSPDGLGADDRAGVYACLEIRKATGCMVLFTDNEERGGVGAREAASLMKDHFWDTAFFLEIDRQGRSEMVFYNGESSQFKAFIGGFGYKEEQGSFSDILILSHKTGIVGVNVSAGYYNQHTLHEYLAFSHLESTIRKVLKILKTNWREYDRDKWQIGEQVYPELGGYNDSGDLYLHDDRHRKGPKMARRWAF